MFAISFHIFSRVLRTYVSESIGWMSCRLARKIARKEKCFISQQTFPQTSPRTLVFTFHLLAGWLSTGVNADTNQKLKLRKVTQSLREC